ncbi:hypothetical protein CRE_03503 [Caenorhabditis remanei]|uniref:CXXC-type zinc finger protein 1 n=1 Tax=Caenorhabditis remanei TaxID=31234 RepID=E3NKN9_CAERE|nr:hypothetical protein CRE_03503 [Caenorhabditis remanei]
MSGLSTKDNEDNEEIWKFRCANCIRCNEKIDCAACWPCRTGKTCEKKRCFSARKMYDEAVKKKADENLKAIMAKTAVREAQAASTSAASGGAGPSEAPEPVEKKKRGRKKKEVVMAERLLSERDYVSNRPTRQQSADLRRKRTQITSASNKEPRQCLNPDCIYEARTDSKYCSDECGKILAKMRLTEILPQRCKEYFSPGPAATRTFDTEIKQRREAVKKEVEELTKAEKNMIGFLEKLYFFVENQIKLQPLGTVEKYDDNLCEACVVCGAPDIALRKYTKHIELCWARNEKAMSFGAPEKNNDNFYCENFDARTGTYCKRLKSLCPEHRKPGIEQALLVCGYPKKWENGSGGDYANTLSELIECDDPFGDEGCRTKKEACHKHHKWIPSLRGSIELEQACLFQKMFELCHETHRLNTQAEWTTNALNIMMHKEPKIVDHDQFIQFVKAQQALSISSDSDGPSTSAASDPAPSAAPPPEINEEIEEQFTVALLRKMQEEREAAEAAKRAAEGGETGSGDDEEMNDDDEEGAEPQGEGNRGKTSN